MVPFSSKRQVHSFKTVSFLSNVATLSGGGIYSDATSDPLIENTLIEDNVPDQLYGLFQNDPKTADIAQKSMAEDSDNDTEAPSSRTRPAPSEKDLVNDRDKIRERKTVSSKAIPLIPILPGPVLDSDGDGLPDQWEVGNLLNPKNASDKMTDPDGDGFGNAYEFFHNTNPQDPGSAPNPTLFVNAPVVIGFPSPLKSLSLSPNPFLQLNHPSLSQPIAGPIPAPSFFTTIQAALNAANDFDIIEVANGTYTGIGNRDLDYLGKPIMLLSKNGPEHTVIDCERRGQGFRFFRGEDERSVLQGITIKNGKTSHGAGIFCGASSPTIQNCILLHNHALQEGGGIYNDSSNPTLINVILANNKAHAGGAIFNGSNASPMLQHCTLASNIASFVGGGLGHLDISSTPEVHNTILWGNIPEQIDNVGNPVISFSNIQGSWLGQSNIDTDPQLTALYRLKSTSPCINQGNVLNTSQLDIDKEQRTGQQRFSFGVDIGADEFVDTDLDGLPDIWENKYFGDLSHDGTEDNDSTGGADGLSNLSEYEHGTDPNKSDTDGDGLPDNDEITAHGTSPTSSDTDGDGLPDNWEVTNLLNPNNASDRMSDLDQDGFGNLYEFFHGTDPQDHSAAPNPTLHVDPFTLPPFGSQLRFRTIQAALDAATNYDIVELADGIYTGIENKNLNYQGKSVMLFSKNGPSHTVVDCKNDGRGFRFFNGEDETSVLRGVTIKNGRADQGAGISCEASSPTIQDCFILRNYALQEGGGLYNDFSSPVLVNLILAQNQADVGGAIFNDKNASPIVQNCTIADNSASGGGGVAHFDSTAISVIHNTILWGNTPEQVDTNGSPVIEYSNIQGGWIGQGNIDSDPQLTALYRLMATSPCIDAGHDSGAPWVDIDGDIRARLHHVNVLLSVDIGADEFVDIDADGLPDNWEINYFGDLTHDAAEDNDHVGGPDGLSNLAEYENGTDPTKSDTDGDGLLDADEINIHGTSPIDADIDNDGLNDRDEIHHGTSPTDADTDGDGLKDGEEITLRTSPTNPDTDGDGIDDGTEVANGTSPQLAVDFDRDGMPDDWESHYGLDFANAADASEDPDGDGLTNLEEYNAKTDPTSFDTDGDLLPDKFELDAGLDPNRPDDPQGDADGDGLSNLDEVIYQTNPTNPDTDGDGVSDGQEVQQGSNPNDNADGGLAPPPEELVAIELTIGDPSGSQSERYNLEVGPLLHQSTNFGEVATKTYDKVFRRGETYEVTIHHRDTDENYTGTPRPDYDYTALIKTNDCICVDDPEGILGVHDESDTFFAIKTIGNREVHKKAYLKICKADLDLDSDHTTDFGGPKRTPFEDKIEEGSSDPKYKGLKFIVVNDVYDTDANGIPGYADGYNLDGTKPSPDDRIAKPVGPKNNLVFVPVVLEIPKPFTNTPTTTVKFDYSASDPSTISPATEEGEKVYPLATGGHLRLWTKEQAEARLSTSVVAGGDFIPTGTKVPAAKLGFDLTKRSSTTVTPDADPRIRTFYLEGIDSSTVLEGERVLVEVKDPPMTATDIVHCTVMKVDVDVDSNNDDAFASPERNLAEDHYEDVANRMGKIVGVNDNDDDGDGIPDFADGFDRDNTIDNVDDVVTNEKFIPIVFELPEPIDRSKAKIRISYDASDPATDLQVTGGRFGIRSGSLRIWSVDGDQKRRKGRIKKNGTSGGDYVAPGTYTAKEFGFLNGRPRTLTNYVEAVTASTEQADRRIVFEVDPDGDVKNPPNFILVDAVRLTSVSLDVDIDSDNNNDFDPPDRNDDEDFIENRTNNDQSPGKLVCTNNDDNDEDGIPDFADGYNRDGIAENADDTTTHEHFVPIVFQLPDIIPVDKATVRIRYDASNPSKVTTDATGEFVRPSGTLRIWNKLGAEPRIGTAINAGGNYVAPGTYSAAKFGFTSSQRTITNYIEATTNSVKVADKYIRFEVTLTDQMTAPVYPASDEVRCTAVGLEFIEIKGLYKNDGSYEVGYTSHDDEGRIYSNRVYDPTDLSNTIWARDTQYVDMVITAVPKNLHLPNGSKILWKVEDPDDPTNEGMSNYASCYVDPNDHNPTRCTFVDKKDKDNVGRIDSTHLFQALPGFAISHQETKFSNSPASPSGYIVKGKSRTLTTNARSAVRLHVQNTGGDNYIVSAQLKLSASAPPACLTKSGTLTVWKQVQVEVKHMIGADRAPDVDTINSSFKKAFVEWRFDSSQEVANKFVEWTPGKWAIGLQSTNSAAPHHTETNFDKYVTDTAPGEFSKRKKGGYMFLAGAHDLTPLSGKVPFLLYPRPTIINDTHGQIAGFVSHEARKGGNTDPSFSLYATVTSPAPGQTKVRLFKDAAKAQLVAEGRGRSGGIIDITPRNASKLHCQAKVTYRSDDTDIKITINEYGNVTAGFPLAPTRTRNRMFYLPALDLSNPRNTDTSKIIPEGYEPSYMTIYKNPSADPSIRKGTSISSASRHATYKRAIFRMFPFAYSPVDKPNSIYRPGWTEMGYAPPSPNIKAKIFAPGSYGTAGRSAPIIVGGKTKFTGALLTFSGFTGTGQVETSTVAHEFGHCLGFAHRCGNKDYTGAAGCFMGYGVDWYLSEDLPAKPKPEDRILQKWKTVIPGTMLCPFHTRAIRNRHLEDESTGGKIPWP